MEYKNECAFAGKALVSVYFAESLKMNVPND